MKNTISTIILTLIYFIVKAQAPDWAWAYSGGAGGDNRSTSTTRDAFGNVYVIGHYNEPTITFGTTTLINADNSGGTHDVFIVKYNALGNVLWAKREGGIGDDNGMSIVTDNIGNVYVTGNYGFQTISIGTFVLTNIGGQNIFIAKYDALGNVLWAKGAGGTVSNLNCYNSGNCVSTDISGNLYVSGVFCGTVNFGTYSLTNIYPSNLTDIFIVKYDPMGNVLWAKREGGDYEDLCLSITNDNSGNFSITGWFYSPSITFGTTTLNNAANSGPDMFIAKYDSLGNVLWSKGAGGSGFDMGRSLSTDSFNNIYLTGIYSSPLITFNTDTLYNAVDSASSYSVYDMFFVKYDPSGNILWTKGADHIDLVNVICDASGNVYLTGGFYPVTTFGLNTITATGLEDMFIVKYDNMGNLIWVKTEGGTGYEVGTGITLDLNNDLYITGWYSSSTINFGATTLINTSFNNYGKNVFTAKLVPTTVGFENKIAPIGINLFPNPTNGIFTISSNDFNFKNCSVYTALGENIYAQSFNTRKSITIDLSALAKGIYFVEIIDENNSRINKKVIIE